MMMSLYPSSITKGMSILSRSLFLSCALILWKSPVAYASDVVTYCASDKPLSLPCELEAYYQDGSETLIYQCFSDSRIYPIENNSTDFAEMLESGKIGIGTKLEILGAYISEKNKFAIPEDAEVGIRTSATSDSRRKLSSTVNAKGTFKFLVLYVTSTAGERPTKNMSGGRNSIQDDVFGTNGDPKNMANIFEQCSNGALDYEPFYNDNQVSQSNRGVYNVQISTTVNDAETSDIVNAALAQAESDFNVSNMNDVSDLDYVMVCLPYGSISGSGKGWLAYAYLRSWLSVYNNKWCSSLSTLAHETGHNINLGHSGDFNSGGSIIQYGDQEGYMGYGYNEDDTPLMCFNSAKTYQLGWFPNHYLDLTISQNYVYDGDLCAYTEYGTLFTASSTKMMVVKLDGGSGDDYYVGFNKATGLRAGTKDSRNMVTIHSVPDLVDTYWGPKSTRRAALSAGQSAVVTVNGIEVTVLVESIGECATVKITGKDTEAPSVSLTPSISSSPSTVPSLSISPSVSLVPSASNLSLSTPYLFGDFYAASKSGVMFDVETKSGEEITITGFDLAPFFIGTGLGDISTNLEIYATNDFVSHDGVKYDASSWTQFFAGSIDPGAANQLLVNVALTTPIGVAGVRGIFITNTDSNNYIKSAYRDDTEYDDSLVTIKPGKFSKLAYFDGTTSSTRDYCRGIEFGFVGIMYYQDTGGMPSQLPSLGPSEGPSESHQPSLSLAPSGSPSKSVAPSLAPSDQPSSNPSLSMRPSTVPSDKPSSNPSVSVSPSQIPTKSPTFEPTKNPTKSPTRSPSDRPSAKPTPYYFPSAKPSTHYPSARPTLSFKPTATSSPSAAATLSPRPSDAPTVNRFQVITTKCYCRYPFRGIDPNVLAARLEAMKAIWLAAVTATIPNKDEWGVTRIIVGDYDARRRLQITARILDESGTVEVEVELTNTVTCASTDGCTDDEQNAALSSGNQVLADVSASAASGELMTNIINESQGTDLVDTFTASSVDDVITIAPEIEIIDPTPFPTPTPPTSSPTASKCNDSSLKFEVLNNGNILSKSCDWVARKSTTLRCDLPGVSSHCPKTCGTCNTCIDGTNMFVFNDNDKMCSTWIANANAKNKMKRCSKIGIADTCRVSCNNCCSSSGEDQSWSTFTMDSFPEKRKTCFWLNEKELRKYRYCQYADVRTRCPSACNSCGNPVEDDSFTFSLRSGNKVTCSWLDKANSRERRSRYCLPGGQYYSPDIRSKCADSCGLTTISCIMDKSNFTFKLGTSDESVSCSWLTKNSAKTEIRRKNYCVFGGEYFDEQIRSNCYKSCGLCQ